MSRAYKRRKVSLVSVSEWSSVLLFGFWLVVKFEGTQGISKATCFQLNTNMSALFNFQGFLAVVLLVICTCTYVKIAYPPLLVKKDGFRGLFWKAARIGERLSPWVAVGCFIMGVLILF